MKDRRSGSSSMDTVDQCDRVIMSSAGQNGHEWVCCCTNKDGFREVAFTCDKRPDAIRRALQQYRPTLYQWRRHDLFGKAWCKVELNFDGDGNGVGGVTANV